MHRVHQGHPHQRCFNPGGAAGGLFVCMNLGEGHRILLTLIIDNNVIIVTAEVLSKPQGTADTDSFHIFLITFIILKICGNKKTRDIARVKFMSLFILLVIFSYVERHH
ncbi:hypothetical protein Btru_044288 [Bulinus truncatus]|nr:hypothetical protein Btru_044288 [Bulinus truncatus]